MSKAGILVLLFLLPLTTRAQHADLASATGRDKVVHPKNNTTGYNQVQGSTSYGKAKKAEIKIYNRLEEAKTLLNKRKYGLAVSRYNDILDWKQIALHPALAAEAREGLGLIHGVFQKYGESIDNLQQALAFHQQSGNIRDQQRVLQYLSNVHYNNGDMKAALHFVRQSLKLAVQLKDAKAEQHALLSEIAALIRMKDWSEAEQGLKGFRKLPVDNKDKALQVRYHTLWGNYYLAKGQPQPGLSCYDSAMQIVQDSGNPDWLALVCVNKFDTYLELHDYKKGLECLQQYQEQNEIIRKGAGGLQGLDRAFPVELYKSEVFIHYNEEKLNNLQKQQQAEENRSKELQLQQGTVERAGLRATTDQQASLLNIKDSLLTETRALNQSLTIAKKLADSVGKLYREKADSLVEINRALEKSGDALGRSKTKLQYSLLITLLLVVIILYQFRRQMIKRAIIQKQKEELEVLMREIHHRVKNNLQIISSLLDLQSETIGDQQATEAIRESRNRVLSMALIHQHLCGDRCTQVIKVKEYINHLAQALIQSYEVKPGSIRLFTDIEDLDLDIDTVIPLGLILNELISNSLKHAFKEGYPGEINVQLNEVEHTLLLQVRDNGRGFSGSIPSAYSTSFGMKLIRAFAKKLKANLDIYDANGACVVLQAYKYKPV